MHDRVWASGLVVVLASGLPVAAGTASSDPVFAVRVSPVATAGVLERALAGAHRRLGHGGCQQIFSDFQDAQGRPLRRRLDALGHSSQSYLGWLIFYDGAHNGRCDTKRYLALAQRDGRAVFVCPEAFRQWGQRDLFLAEAILIHEMLHSLGLGENPPTSQEITAQVMRRCRD